MTTLNFNPKKDLTTEGTEDHRGPKIFFRCDPPCPLWRDYFPVQGETLSRKERSNATYNTTE